MKKNDTEFAKFKRMMASIDADKRRKELKSKEEKSKDKKK